MEYGCQKAKNLHETDYEAGKSGWANKRPAGPVKTMGYPCDLHTGTMAAKDGNSKSCPSDLKPGNNSDYGKPKSKYM